MAETTINANEITLVSVAFQNAVKQALNDDTLGNQEVLDLIERYEGALKKIIVYMEEKYLVCYPVYKFQVTSDQPRYDER